MRKVFILIAIALFLMTTGDSALAQVYKITTRYSILSVYSPDLGPSLSFNEIDTGNHETFIVDLDKKTISSTVNRFGLDPLIIPITEIVHDAKNRLYILRTPTEEGNKWNYYKLQIGMFDSPGYVQKVKQEKNGIMERDTVFQTYTINLVYLSFYARCGNIKDMAISKNEAEAKKQMSVLTHNIDESRRENHLLEMRNGIIYWTQGKKTRVLPISTSVLVKEPGTEGIMVRCAEQDGEYYDIMYAITSTRMAKEQFAKIRFILISKFVKGKKTYAAVLH